MYVTNVLWLGNDEKNEQLLPNTRDWYYFELDANLFEFCRNGFLSFPLLLHSLTPALWGASNDSEQSTEYSCSWQFIGLKRKKTSNRCCCWIFRNSRFSLRFSFLKPFSLFLLLTIYLSIFIIITVTATCVRSICFRAACTQSRSLVSARTIKA